MGSGASVALALERPASVALALERPASVALALERPDRAYFSWDTCYHWRRTTDSGIMVLDHVPDVVALDEDAGGYDSIVRTPAVLEAAISSS